ncbi:hypothetical protein ACU8V4_13750 [Pseudoalteromonas mariniglutinosa]
MSIEQNSMRNLIKKLGYDFERSNPPAYTLALALQKVGFDRDRIVQIVSLVYPLEINF